MNNFDLSLIFIVLILFTTGVANEIQPTDTYKPFVISKDQQSITINAEVILNNKLKSIDRTCSKVTGADTYLGNGTHFISTNCVESSKSRIFLTHRTNGQVENVGILSYKIVAGGFYIYSTHRNDDNEIAWMVVN